MELRTIFQQYILKAGVRNVYTNACFPLNVTIHGEGERFIKSFDELQAFVASVGFIRFWLGELELPSMANCFNVAITVLWINGNKGNRQAHKTW